MIDLSGRVALVTGGTKGIGYATAEALAEAGARVAISARTASEVTAAAERLSDHGQGEVEGIPCDVRRPDNCEELVERTVDRLGGLDILVNNAGMGIFKNVRDMTGDDFRKVLETNLFGVFYLVRAAVPHLTASEFAWVVNIGSLAGRNTFPGGVAYNASKFGLLGMTEAMMLDLRHDGIRVSCIMPGSVDTTFGTHTTVGERPWALQSGDVALAVMQLLAYPTHAHVSRIEMRPSMPPRG